MITKEKMDFAVNQVVNNCLKAKKDEKAMVITDTATKHIGLAIANLLEKVTGKVTTFVMEDFGPRPEDGSAPLKFPEEIGDVLAKANVSVLAAGSMNGEYKSFRLPMLEVIKANKKLRHAHMIGITEDLMDTGMQVDYTLIAKMAKKIAEIVTKAEKIVVTTAKGTNFQAVFNKDWKWTVLDGSIKEGHLSNLPEGEAFTCPTTVDGKVIVDGVLGDYLMGKYGIIEKTPLILELKDGYVISISSTNKEIEKDINAFVKKSENTNRVGEFGIGFNIGLKSLVGNLLQDEKFPGVHIALGDSLKDYSGANWSADAHLDLVIQKTTIGVDGKVIMKEGKFLI